MWSTALDRAGLVQCMADGGGGAAPVASPAASQASSRKRPTDADYVPGGAKKIRGPSPIVAALNTFGVPTGPGSSKIAPAFDGIVCSASVLADTDAKKCALLVMSLCFLKYFVTEDLLNMQDKAPEHPVKVPNTAYATLLAIHNALAALSDALDDSRKEGNFAFAAALNPILTVYESAQTMLNRDARKKASERDPCIAANCLVHIMNADIKVFVDSDGKEITKEDGACI